MPRVDRRTFVAAIGIVALFGVAIAAIVWWPQPTPRAAPGLADVTPASAPATAAPTPGPPAPETVFTENGRTFREYGREHDLSAVGGLWAGYADVGGQLAYVAQQGDVEFVVHGGREIGRELSDVAGIFELIDVGGKPAFLSLRADLTALGGFGDFISLNGKKIGQQYDYVREPAAVNGRLAYVGVIADSTRPQGERTVVNYDGQEYGQRYGRVEVPFAYEGKLAFIASGGAASPDGSVVVVTGGQETLLPASQYEAGVVKSGSGTIIFVQDGVLNRDEVLINGQRIVVGESGADRSNAQYDDVLEAAAVGGKPAFLARKDGRGVIVYGGQEYGHRFDYVYDLPGEKNDAYSLQLPYLMGRPNLGFTALKYLGDVGGKLTYVATVGFTAEGYPRNIIVEEE